MENPSTILIVDDDPRGRAVLEGLLLNEGHKLEFAASGPEALSKAASSRPDIILLDVMMPDMDGYEVCKRLRADHTLAEVPVIFVTALDDRDALLQGLEAGGDEFITKPFNRVEMRTRIRSLTRLNRYQRLMAERQLLEKTLEGTIGILTEILSLTDPHSFGLAQKVRHRVNQLTAALKAPSPRPIELAALLSPIGCVTIPAPLMNKARAGEILTHPERVLWERVPEIGRNLLAHLPQLTEVADIVFNQNKNFDGTGFPIQVPGGEKIPLGARILKLASDYTRHEAKGRPAQAIFADLNAHAAHYDPAVFAAFKNIIAEEHSRAHRRGEPQEVKLAQLQIGWTLRQDLFTRDDMLLLSAGHTLTQTTLERIRNFSAITGLREPILAEPPPPEN